MKLERALSLITALSLASCSAGPSSPTAAPASAPRIGATDAGQVSADAISTTRMRLRRVGGGDIQTGLATGQVISVPVNVNLDVWAEIARLESDRARLFVDWGNGNVDFAGCGSCRLENTYRVEGRYTLTAKVVDLNAPPGSEIVTQATVTIVVVPAPAVCSAVGTDFESVAFMPSPVHVGGATYTEPTSAIGSYGSLYVPVLINKTFTGGGSTLTIEFDSDKTSFTAGFAMNAGGTASYQAASATGDLVASGAVSLPPIPSPPPGVIGSILSFSSDAPFRRIVFSLGGSPGYAIDNVSASCK